LPPPYAGQQAPAYESTSGAGRASASPVSGVVNSGFSGEKEGDADKGEEEASDKHGKATGTETMTASERELNASWF